MRRERVLEQQCSANINQSNDYRRLAVAETSQASSSCKRRAVCEACLGGTREHELDGELESAQVTLSPQDGEATANGARMDLSQFHGLGWLPQAELKLPFPTDRRKPCKSTYFLAPHISPCTGHPPRCAYRLPESDAHIRVHRGGSSYSCENRPRHPPRKCFALSTRSLTRCSFTASPADMPVLPSRSLCPPNCHARWPLEDIVSSNELGFNDVRLDA